VFKQIEVAKNQVLLNIGKQAKHLYFIQYGYIRLHNNYNGKPYPVGFITGEFTAVLSSLWFKTQSRWCTQTITPCCLLSIEQSEFMALQ